MKVVFHPAADTEFTEAVAYYVSIDPQLGQRFLLEMEQLIREISAHPQTFRLFDPPLRRHFSLSFPYGIIYTEREDRCGHALETRTWLLEKTGGVIQGEQCFFEVKRRSKIKRSVGGAETGPSLLPVLVTF